MDSFRKVVWSLPITFPIAGLLTTVRACCTGSVAKPSAVMAAALLLLILRSLVVPVGSVVAPRVRDVGVVAPLRASILASRVQILSVTLIWLARVAPLARNVGVWPPPVIVLGGGPAVNPVAKVS